jgi:hypothetical protein
MPRGVSIRSPFIPCGGIVRVNEDQSNCGLAGWLGGVGPGLFGQDWASNHRTPKL